MTTSLYLNYFKLFRFYIPSFTDKFNAHLNLKAHVQFVINFVELFDLLIDYRDLQQRDSDTSNELKTFYLNELLVSKSYQINTDQFE
jgi:hypothetical protein